MRWTIGALILAALLGSNQVMAASAQSSVYQTVTSPAGYQYQVPSDWIAGAVTDSSASYMGSPSMTEDAYVVVRSPEGATPVDKLTALTQLILAPTDLQSSYVVTNPSSPLQVAGADVAGGGAATFLDQNGAASQEYVVAAIEGTTGYALIVDVPVAVDAATPSLAQTILGSFRLAPSNPAPVSAADPAGASAAAPVAAAASGAGSVTPVYASDFSSGATDWKPLKGGETVGVDTTHEMTSGGPALKVTTPGHDVPEGALVNSGSVTAGTVYTVNLWVYADRGATLQVALGVNEVGVYATDAFTGNGGWQEITLAGTSPATGENQIQVRTSDSPQGTAFWVSSAVVDPGLTER